MDCNERRVSWAIVITATALAVTSGASRGQTATSPPPPAPDANAARASAGLEDLSAMTFSCPKAALNAAAREAAKVPTQGTYQFAYFNTIVGSHHARYEVHFTSNYEGEPDLKYCVTLYCQQGWDPAAAEPTVTLLNAKSMEACAEPHGASKNRKRAVPATHEGSK